MKQLFLRYEKTIYIILIVLLSGVFLFSAFMIYRHVVEAQTSAKSFQELTELVEPSAPQVAAPPTAAETYASVVAKNSDFTGWLKIEGTKIDYPVMYTPDRKNFYLRRGFDQQYNYYGVPYVAEHCVPDESDNLVIYGHNMNNGSMFYDLTRYESRSFYEDHPEIQFDTLKGFGTYRIIAVFKTTASSTENFEYFRFADGDKTAFDQYVAKCKEFSLYSIEETATYGDSLITLSTCEYTRKNGRFVVVAKKIK